jgi:RNA polymerase sigma factor (sigma-70 family)
MDSPVTRTTLLVRLRDLQDELAWPEFVATYSPLVYRFCRRRGLQECDATDVAQEVFAAVAAAIPEFEYDKDRGSFRSWLFTVTRSKLNNFYARRARQPQGTGRTTVHQSLDAQPADDEVSDWDEEYQRNLFQLAAEQVQREFESSTWNAFWKAAVENVPASEVASQLSLSTGAVYIAKSRVIKRMRQRVAELENALL